MIVEVRHNMEVAHRLTTLPGKCEQIHGHSMKLTLRLFGEALDGIFEGRDFGAIKRVFRSHIDTTYDHHLLLNVSDPWAQPIETVQAYENATGSVSLPGLVTVPGDPTVENLAQWIADWAADTFELEVQVTIDETATNSVTAGATPSA